MGAFHMKPNSSEKFPGSFPKALSLENKQTWSAYKATEQLTYRHCQNVTATLVPELFVADNRIFFSYAGTQSSNPRKCD